MLAPMKTNRAISNNLHIRGWCPPAVVVNINPPAEPTDNTAAWLKLAAAVAPIVLPVLLGRRK